MATESVQISREELYELVWSEPGKVLANRFGISDVGLSKICKRHRIPRPPRGYWAKRQAGHKPTKRSGPQKLDTPISVVPVKLPAWQHHNTDCLACAGQVIGGAAQRYKS